MSLSNGILTGLEIAPTIQEPISVEVMGMQNWRIILYNMSLNAGHLGFSSRYVACSRRSDNGVQCRASVEFQDEYSSVSRAPEWKYGYTREKYNVLTVFVDKFTNNSYGFRNFVG